MTREQASPAKISFEITPTRFGFSGRRHVASAKISLSFQPKPLVS
jgi:hypothetical protein